MIVSVVTVNYRRADRIHHALDAVRDFVGERLEFVVVDNSAGDDALSTLPRDVRVIRNRRNMGYAAAVNQGMAASEGEIALLLNPDVTRWQGDMRTILEAFRDPHVAAVTPRLVDEEGRVEPSCRHAPRPIDFLAESLALTQRFPRWQGVRRLRMLDWDHSDERDVEAATGACLFIRRSAYDAIGPFDERFFVYGEEIDWLVRAARHGLKTRFLPSVTVTHLGGASTPASSETLERLLIESHYRYTEKHFGRGQELGLRSALLMTDLLRVLRHPSRTRALMARARVHLGLRYERPV